MWLRVILAKKNELKLKTLETKNVDRLKMRASRRRRVDVAFVYIYK